MKIIENVYIIGMGALGVLYGHFFERKLGKDKVKFIGDEKRIARFNKEGVYANGKRCEFQMINPLNCAEKADFLIFAVKGTALPQAIDAAGGFVGEDTVIMSVLNGISSEEIIGKELGENHLIYAVAQGMDATKLGNKLTCMNFGELRIGVPKEEADKMGNLERVVEFFDRIKMPYQVEDDIEKRLWSKWMLNVGGNQVIMVNEGTYSCIQKPGPIRDSYIAAMGEVMAVANASGVEITDAEFKEYLAISDRLNPEGMPSMRQDGLMKRPSEVEMFAGTVISKAKALGIDVPVNQELYRKIKDMESKY